MPELPEVETVKKTLERFVIGQTISAVDIQWPNIIKMPADTEIFKEQIKGQTIREMGRKGKFLLFYLDDYVLVSHLRMEGKYNVYGREEPIRKHTHVRFTFESGSELRYNDVRKFGTMHLYPKGQEMSEKPLSQLGPDPFDETFTTDYFHAKLQRTTRSIKTALLDQSIVTGLGNIYVDETLFRAGIHPLTAANHITKQQVELLRTKAIDTLQEAILAGGTTIRSYTNSQGDMGMFQQELYVYGQQDEPCKQCGTVISKIKVNGRGTHFCPACQKAE